MPSPLRYLTVAALPAILLTAPGHAQGPAPTPRLERAEAIQMMEEAGFLLVDGQLRNRCNRPAQPKMAFIDLNADGAAELHLADVDPQCYGKPGAYFAILAQTEDRSWRQLIAEDGIVGFEKSRRGGWNDLSLEPRDSACPGRRHFDGTLYRNPQPCASSPDPRPTVSALPTRPPLSGSRTEQLAQLFSNLVVATADRGWDSAMAAFPGTVWTGEERHKANWYGSTLTRSGEISLRDAVYTVSLSGVVDRVNEYAISGPGNDNLQWSAIEAAMPAAGLESRNIGCHSPTGFGYVRLTAGGRSIVMHKFLNYGTGVPSTDVYMITPDNSFDGSSEAAIVADRSTC